MANPVNEPLSDFELLGRGLYCTSQMSKSGAVRQSAFYPLNKEDQTRPGFFTNKLSMFRLCRDIKDDGTHPWTGVVDSARQFNFPKRVFRGLGVGTVRFFKEHGFYVEPAASAENPYHMHLVMPWHDEPFRKVSSVAEVISEARRSDMEDLRHEVYTILINDGEIAPDDYPTPCDLCLGL